MYASYEPCPMCLGAIYWSRLSALFYANTSADAARIGFDDELLYREVALPARERSLPMRRIPSADAIEVFAEWEAYPDKTPY